MAIDTEGFNALLKAFATAKKNNVLLYDIMTERHEINSILQKEFAHLPAFGQLERGTPENPPGINEAVIQSQIAYHNNLSSINQKAKI